MKEKELVELGDDSLKWEAISNFALGKMAYLRVHPSHILTLLKNAEAKSYTNAQLKKVKESIETLVDFIELEIE